MSFVGLAIFLAVMGGCGLAGWRLVRDSRSVIEAAGRVYGLTVKPTETTVEGYPRAYKLRLGYQPHQGNHFDIAVLDLPRGLLDMLTIRTQANSEGFSGDSAFDRVYRVQDGAGPMVLAILNQRVRRLFDGFHGSVELVDGKLVLFYVADLTKVGADLNKLLDLADALVASARIDNAVPTLAQMALHDAEPGVRLRAGRMLMESFADHPVAQDFLLQARSSEDGQLRLLTAEIDGMPAGLTAMLGVLTGGWFAVEARLRATRMVHRLLPRDERVFGALDDVIGTSNGRLLQDVLTLYQAYGRSPSVGLVSRRLSVVRTTDQLALMRSLVHSKELEAARVLMRSHLFAKDSAIAELACQLLGQIGDIGSVEVLYQIAESATRPGDVRRAAREAIASIQLRSGRAGLRGGLQIAEELGETGGLSPAGAAFEGGQLEVVEPIVAPG